MRGLSFGTELLEFARDPDDSSWYYASLAIHGVPCVRFSIGADVIAELLHGEEEALAGYLERQARIMIDTYGDRRSPKPDAFAEFMEA